MNSQASIEIKFERCDLELSDELESESGQGALEDDLDDGDEEDTDEDGRRRTQGESDSAVVCADKDEIDDWITQS